MPCGWIRPRLSTCWENTVANRRPASREALEFRASLRMRLDEAAGRVLAAKRRFSLFSQARSGRGRAVDALNIDMLERDISEASMTVVRNGGAIPVAGRRAGSSRLNAFPAVDSFADFCRKVVTSVRVVHLDFAELENVALENYGAVIVLTRPREPWSAAPIDQKEQAGMVNRLADRRRRYEFIAAAIYLEPYDLRRFLSVPNYVCSYGYRPASLEEPARVIAGGSGASDRRAPGNSAHGQICVGSVTSRVGIRRARVGRTGT